jgi:hypothetical protein
MCHFGLNVSFLCREQGKSLWHCARGSLQARWCRDRARRHLLRMEGSGLEPMLFGSLPARVGGHLVKRFGLGDQFMSAYCQPTPVPSIWVSVLRFRRLQDKRLTISRRTPWPAQCAAASIRAVQDYNLFLFSSLETLLMATEPLGRLVAVNVPGVFTVGRFWVTAEADGKVLAAYMPEHTVRLILRSQGITKYTAKTL